MIGGPEVKCKRLCSDVGCAQDVVRQGRVRLVLSITSLSRNVELVWSKQLLPIPQRKAACVSERGFDS